MISNHKRQRKIEGDNKSQEQTTSKKTASSSIVAMQRAAMGGRENSPANGQIPVNALASILKRSQEKNAMQAAQQNANVSQQKRGSNASLNQTQNRIQKSVTQKDLSSSKKGHEASAASRAAEPRADSQPAKQTHSLQKQDSSKYLRGGEGQKVPSQQQETTGEKRIANRANRQSSGINSQSKPNSNSKVIYKVSNAANCSADSGPPLFAVRPNFGHCASPSERLKTLDTPSQATASELFNRSGGRKREKEPICA